MGIQDYAPAWTCRDNAGCIITVIQTIVNNYLSFITRIKYSKLKGVVNLTFGASSLNWGSEKRRNQFVISANTVKQRAA
jgi:hypothetical protein